MERDDSTLALFVGWQHCNKTNMSAEVLCYPSTSCLVGRHYVTTTQISCENDNKKTGYKQISLFQSSKCLQAYRPTGTYAYTPGIFPTIDCCR